MSADEAHLPPPPGPLFLVGIGGIGMSGLAQLLHQQGYRVGGSDRDVSSPGRDDLIAKLAGLGLELWPQDGSGVRAMAPAALVRSTAVEAGNPDLQAAAGRPLLHRARALAEALNRLPGRQIAVAGSCGKTTVTAWLAAALRHLGYRVLTVCGGYMVEHETDRCPGNVAADPDPEWLVVEVDESDGSLVSFDPDYGVLLNIGTDHFDHGKLLGLFGQFLGRCRRGATVLDSLLPALPPLPAGRTLTTFAPAADSARSAGCVAVTDYRPGVAGIRFGLGPLGQFGAEQFGRHSAVNGAAVVAALQALGIPLPPDRLAAAVAGFRGVRRRFERVGVTRHGVPVYDDYAHNVEKLAAALRTGQELAPGPVHAVFQPHGYGPFGFMREPLRTALAEVLRPGDSFHLLPVYYAGGSCAFRPTTEEVAAEYRDAGLAVSCFADRAAAAAHLTGPAVRDGVILIMGARDPALPTWIRGLTVPPA